MVDTIVPKKTSEVAFMLLACLQAHISIIGEELSQVCLATVESEWIAPVARNTIIGRYSTLNFANLFLSHFSSSNHPNLSVTLFIRIMRSFIAIPAHPKSIDIAKLENSVDPHVLTYMSNLNMMWMGLVRPPRMLIPGCLMSSELRIARHTRPSACVKTSTVNASASIWGLSKSSSARQVNVPPDFKSKPFQKKPKISPIQVCWQLFVFSLLTHK